MKQVRVILETYRVRHEFSVMDTPVKEIHPEIAGCMEKKVVGSNSHSTLLSQVDCVVGIEMKWQSLCLSAKLKCWRVEKKISVRCRAAFKPPANAR